MAKKAYLILHINTKEGKLSGAGIYSEENPTSDLIRAFPVCMLTMEGQDLEDAENKLLAWCRTYGHEWVIELLKKTRPDKYKTKWERDAEKRSVTFNNQLRNERS